MSDEIRGELEKLQRLVGMMAIQMFELRRQLEQVERDAISDYELVRAELAQQEQRSAFRGMLP